MMGSSMSQIRERVATSMKGSMTAVVASGMTSMSEDSIVFQPRMEDPSKPSPSSKVASVSSAAGIEKCCQAP